LPVLWIRIGSDPHHFARPGSGGINSKQMITILFSRKFQYAAYNTENYDTFDTEEEDKTLKTKHAVTKEQKNSDFRHV
jgi:hypothetical protein